VEAQEQLAHAPGGRLDAALRRALDVGGALGALLVLSPLLLLIVLVVRASSRGPAFFVQQRIGRHGRPFGLVKFRSMRSDGDGGPQLTVAGDRRITRFGALLRRSKLDELPQLWNVLRGDMSLVGPRPEVACYVATFSASQRAVLAARPGITDPASLAFRAEAELLAQKADPERAYREEILPRKLAISLAYLARRTVWSDLGVLLRTAALLVGARPAGRCERTPEAA
jgi:lipopolysaccharide/colanic/teichoic acid biosynthesis glycosyltransferase